ncbi:MAG: hypothetical protein RLP14_01555 [Owenweeksia sp.]
MKKLFLIIVTGAFCINLSGQNISLSPYYSYGPDLIKSGGFPTYIHYRPNQQLAHIDAGLIFTSTKKHGLKLEHLLGFSRLFGDIDGVDSQTGLTVREKISYSRSDFLLAIGISKELFSFLEPGIRFHWGFNINTEFRGDIFYNPCLFSFSPMLKFNIKKSRKLSYSWCIMAQYKWEGDYFLGTSDRGFDGYFSPAIALQINYLIIQDSSNE